MELSIIIPSRRERFLDRTIFDIKEKFKSDYEIIVILDGKDEKRIAGVRYIFNRKSKGMRRSINQGVEIAKGKYLLKLDAHCKVDDEMDIKLLREHQENWVQIPTRKRLNAHNWKIVKDERPDVNYMCLNPDQFGIEQRGRNKNKEAGKKLLDDTEVFQGSCYLIKKDFFKKVGLLDDINFNSTGHEAAEIAYKVRYNGGRVIRNKKTWYAHARLGRFYVSDKTKSKKAIKSLYEGNTLLHG